MNKLKFLYTSHNGTNFYCETCDFSTPVEVTSPDVSTTESAFLRVYSTDLAEMIGYHATNIWPQLNGFQGYDTIHFIIR